jgi:cold shock CspA family protein
MAYEARRDSFWLAERAGLNTLNEGQAIEYDLENNRNGKQAAINLKVK